MDLGSFEVLENKVIIRIKDSICENSEDLLTSRLLKEIVKRSVKKLIRKNSLLLKIFGPKEPTESIDLLVRTMQFLVKMPGELVPNVVKGSEIFFKQKDLFNQFIEYLYNYWRSFDRFILCDSTGDTLDKRPYRTFNLTIEHLTHLIRATYRDLEENLTGDHPRVYRQVAAGAEIATISVPKTISYPEKKYFKLNAIPVIRQVLLNPPLILNPPMNKRSGRFEKVTTNPIDHLDINTHDWLGYPAMVGDLIIMVYFHKKFFELGFSLSNLFELASDRDLEKSPDAVYLFGVPDSLMKPYPSPTIFYDDEKNNILLAAVPRDDEFGYFGYLKKMILTLHNIKVMKRGKLPFHGAMAKIILKGDKEATILMIGDTAAGKSETLEALRQLGDAYIQDMIIIADDMGSMEIDKKGNILGYGTEIGAFLRLDDLKPGYAFGQMDRAIIMSPHKVNARIVLPVTTLENILKGYRIDLVLYANNYEEIDEERDLIERFSTYQEALKVFKEGAVMSKGTTSSRGIVHSYFANIFGPPQYKNIHDKLAEKYFKAMFDRNIFVGQMRTRLGIPGFEQSGPRELAEQLLKTLLTL